MDEQDKFTFFVEAHNFYFGFFYKEFDQDLIISLDSVVI